MMTTPIASYGVFDAKNRLTALLDQVEDGVEIVITRRGRAVARLVPIDSGFDRARARLVVAGLRDASGGLRLEGESIASLVAEGRR